MAARSSPRARSQSIRFSLGTNDPATVKILQASIAAHLETVWQALRQADPVRLTIATMDATAVIPSNRTRKVIAPHDAAACKHRTRIERCFSRPKHLPASQRAMIAGPCASQLCSTSRDHDPAALTVDSPQAHDSGAG
jgi:hypothetical protein